MFRPFEVPCQHLWGRGRRGASTVMAPLNIWRTPSPSYSVWPLLGAQIKYSDYYYRFTHVLIMTNIVNNKRISTEYSPMHWRPKEQAIAWAGNRGKLSIHQDATRVPLSQPQKATIPSILQTKYASAMTKSIPYYIYTNTRPTTTTSLHSPLAH